VTKPRVFATLSGIWCTACCVFAVLLVNYRKFNETSRVYCHLDNHLEYFVTSFTAYFPLTLILILNVWILIVAEKQRKRILAETAVAYAICDRQSGKHISEISRFFHAFKAVKTFSIVVAVLTFCVLTPTVVGLVLYSSCSESCKQLWFVVFHFEFYAINSVVNAYIYGMRHIKYRKAPGQILLRILRLS
jgi:hypothetical protein